MVVVTFFAFLSPPAQAQPAAVCVPGVTCVTLPPVTVTVPRLVTIRVPQPNVTVTVPGAVKTVTDRVTRVVNGSVTRTVTVPIRVTQQIQGPVNTVTKTVVESVQVGQDGRTTSQRATVVGGSTQAASTVTVTGTPSPTTKVVTNTKTERVTLTKIQAVGISLAILIIGALIAGLCVLWAYRAGWILGDAGNRKFIEDTVDDLRYKK